MAEPLRLLGEEIHFISWRPGGEWFPGPKHWCSRWRKCPSLLCLRWCIENVSSTTYDVIRTAAIGRVCCNSPVFLNYMVYMDVSFLWFVFSKDVLQTPNRVNLAATAGQLNIEHLNVCLSILVKSTCDSGFLFCQCWWSRVCVCRPTGLSAPQTISRHFNRETAADGQLRK